MKYEILLCTKSRVLRFSSSWRRKFSFFTQHTVFTLYDQYRAYDVKYERSEHVRTCAVYVGIFHTFKTRRPFARENVCLVSDNNEARQWIIPYGVCGGVWSNVRDTCAHPDRGSFLVDSTEAYMFYLSVMLLGFPRRRSLRNPDSQTRSNQFCHKKKKK